LFQNHFPEVSSAASVKYWSSSK